MAIITIGDIMSFFQWEKAMIQTGWLPAGVKGVAVCTIRWEVCRDVIRVSRTVVVVLMTSKAVCGRVFKGAIGMALKAIGDFMPFDQWEKIMAYTAGTPAHCCHIVTLITVGRIACGSVIRHGSRQIFLRMTGIAIIPYSGKL